MRQRTLTPTVSFPKWLLFLLLVALMPATLNADLIRMVNGDQYFGQVTSVDSKTVVLHSQFLGTLRLPRTSVAAVGFGIEAATNLSALPSPTNVVSQAVAPVPTNSAPRVAPGLATLGSQTNLIGQVRRQFLSDASPEANAKFDELLNGLMSGQLSMSDLRSQAQTAADQLRAAKKDLGPEAGGLLDTYLGILDHFLKDTSSEPAPSGPPTVKSRPLPGSADE